MHALSRGGSRQGTAHRCAKGLPPLLHLHRQDPEESETGGGGKRPGSPVASPPAARVPRNPVTAAAES